MIFIGIDPGKSGGIAWVDPHKSVHAFKMPDTERDIWDSIDALGHEGTTAFIERVSAMPKQGVSSTFKFGMNYGFLRACLIAAKIPFEEVTPGKWQRSLGCLSGGDKNVTKAKAQQIFPELKITHAIADALLIAEYGRRVRG